MARFREPKSGVEEMEGVESAVPKSTVYKNKWAVNVFKEWQNKRVVKNCSLEPGGMFNTEDLSKVEALDCAIENMSASSLNYWLSKFVQEVANAGGGRYPGRTLYGIICGLKRHLQWKNYGSSVVNPLDITDKRFKTFRRILDAEMKSATRAGVTLQTKQEEKESVTTEEEELFWSHGLLGKSTAKSLLYTVYFYNGKLFGLRGEHRNITLANIRISEDCIMFEENVCKTFHGGITDLKYVPRYVTHICHERGESHERCLVELYRLYIGLCEIHGKGVNAFYFRAKTRQFGFDKAAVGINTLNRILPEMCECVGVKKKTAHCLRVTCASALFQSGVNEKLIRERTGHRSNALFKYEKSSREQELKVSSVLSADKLNDEVQEDKEKDSSKNSTSVGLSSFPRVFEQANFQDCEIKVIVKNCK